MNDQDQDQDQDQANPERAADLASLEARAAEGATPAGTAAVAVHQADQAPPPPSDQAMMFAAMIVRAVRPLAGYAAPALKEAPDDLWGPAVEGTAVLLDHYGVGGASFARTPWGRFAFGLVPLVSFAAVHQLTAPKDDKPAAAAPAGNGPARIGAPDLAPAAPPPATPGSNTVTIGAPL